MKPADEPATEQQLAFLARFGLRGEYNLTRAQATEMLRDLQAHADAPGNPSGNSQLSSRDPRQHWESPGGSPEERALRREEFWLDTCREAGHMRKACPMVLDLYKIHGCRFATPAHYQVREVLGALDAAIPTWEKDHPEIFFQTLELNFPELVRHC